MSDLVEKVVNEIAICRKSGGINCEQDCDYCKDDATRAIKAVAQHLAGIGYPFGAGRVAQTTGGQRMSDARTVIAKTTHSWRVLNFSAAEREADAILAALAEAGLEIRARGSIEALEAEAAEANRIVKTYYAENERLETALDAAEARAERLRVALQNIKAIGFGAATYKLGRNIGKAVEIARKALEDDRQ